MALWRGMISASPLSVRLIRSLTFFLAAPPAVKCKKYIALNHYLKKANHFPVPLSATFRAPWRSDKADKKNIHILFSHHDGHSTIFLANKWKWGQITMRVSEKIKTRHGQNKPFNTILQGKLLLSWLQCQMWLSHCSITEKKQAYAARWG